MMKMGQRLPTESADSRFNTQKTPYHKIATIRVVYSMLLRQIYWSKLVVKYTNLECLIFKEMCFMW